MEPRRARRERRKMTEQEEGAGTGGLLGVPRQCLCALAIARTHLHLELCPFLHVFRRRCGFARQDAVNGGADLVAFADGPWPSHGWTSMPTNDRTAAFLDDHTQLQSQESFTFSCHPRSCHAPDVLF